MRILSGGAAQGLVAALAPHFHTPIEGTFGAVGTMRDKLLAGAPVDLLILTRTLIDELTRAGHVRASAAANIGVVHTAMAVRAGDPVPPIGDAAALRTALCAADGIYIPDPKLATAGIHFAKVIEALGLGTELDSRLRPFPNGAAAMRALAAQRSGRPIGCTQATEILSTPGVTLAGPLPAESGLATVYTAAVSATAMLPDAAWQFAALLTGKATREVRSCHGFQPVDFR